MTIGYKNFSIYCSIKRNKQKNALKYSAFEINYVKTNSKFNIKEEKYETPTFSAFFVYPFLFQFRS